LPEITPPAPTSQIISSHDIGHSGTSTGITNSIRRDETTNERTDVLVESMPPIQISFAKTTTISASGEKDRGDIMQREQSSATPFAESQFYARTSHTSATKRNETVYGRSDDLYSSLPIDETFHDAVDDLNPLQDQIITDKSKNICIFLLFDLPVETNKQTGNK
jgi:hypothetical protein